MNPSSDFASAGAGLVPPPLPTLPLTDGNWVATVVNALYEVLGAHGHVLYEGGSVVPPNDPSTLFATAGIQHWRDWVLAADPASDAGRVGAQWCVRMNTLEKVGQSNFLTSFCMLSVLTRGTRGREEALTRMLSVFVNKWGLAFDRLAFVATGEGPHAPEDTESLRALERLGVGGERVAARPRKWAMPFKPDGPTGPELFVLFDRTRVPCGEGCGPNCGCGRYLHFWNLEFLENRRLPDGGTERVAMPFLDSAGSIDWTLGAITQSYDLYQTLALRSIYAFWCEALDGHAPRTEQLKILTDHARTITLLLGIGIEPGPRRHGHVLRRLIRRSFALLTGAGAELGLLAEVVGHVHELYAAHPGFPAGRASETETLAREAESFRRQNAKARAEYDKLAARPGGATPDALFHLHASNGLPWELLERWLEEDGLPLDRERLTALRNEDRDRSRGLLS